MTTQEKINDLANAALRSAETKPAAAARKSPATSAPAGSPAAASATPAKSFSSMRLDTELREALEARDVKMKKKHAKARWAMNLVILALLGSATTWATVSPVGKAKLDHLVKAIKESKGDVKSLTGILGVYDKQLDKIAVQGARVDSATRALGVDPSKENDSTGIDLNAEMKRMAGGTGGPTSLERDEKFKEKFGVVSKVMGIGPSKAKEKAESDVQF